MTRKMTLLCQHLEDELERAEAGGGLGFRPVSVMLTSLAVFPYHINNFL